MITDYFQKKSSEKKSEETDFVIKNTVDINGFYYVKNLLTDSELIQVKKWVHEATYYSVSRSAKSRKVAQFGKVYDYRTKKLKEEKNRIPENIMEIMKKACERNKTLPAFPKNYEHCQIILNQYKHKQSIQPHVDHPKLFGDVIFCFTFGSSKGNIVFENTKDASHKMNVHPQHNSIYVMTKDARYKWKHSMEPLKDKNSARYSITIRTIRNPNN